MHWFLFIALWGGLAFGFMNIIPTGYLKIFNIATGIIFVIWAELITKRKIKDQQSVENEKQRVVNKEKESLLENYGLPMNCPKYKYLSGHDKISNKYKIHVWVKKDILNLLVGNEDKQKYQIHLSDINFYSIKGDIRQEVENKGEDMTVAETIVAEGMFGTAAAMKRNQVVQDIKNIDERKTIINAIVDGKNSFIFFEGPDLYNYLLETIPEKEQSFVVMSK